MSSAPVCGQNSAIPQASPALRPVNRRPSCQLPLPSSPPKLALGPLHTLVWMLLPCLCLGGPFYPFLSLKHLLMFIEVKSTQWTPYGWHAIWHLHLRRDPQPPLQTPEVLMAPKDCHEVGPFTLSLSDAPDEGRLPTQYLLMASSPLQ